jgi:hypothetical protein
LKLRSEVGEDPGDDSGEGGLLAGPDSVSAPPAPAPNPAGETKEEEEEEEKEEEEEEEDPSCSLGIRGMKKLATPRACK